MPRVLLCSTPRVGSVSYAEKMSELMCLPLAFQPWEPYAFNKQPEEVKKRTLEAVDSQNVFVHSHIHVCSDKIKSFDYVIYIGRKDRIRQAWSFFVALHNKKMQNLKIENQIIPRPSSEVIQMFIDWIRLWDQMSAGQHVVFYEDLNLKNNKWQQCVYSNIQIEDFAAIENSITEQLGSRVRLSP